MGKSIEQRSSYWDNIKGILIFLTVFAHILYGLQGNSEMINHVVDYIYLFHMPAFVFVSGYFGKGERAHSVERIGRLIFLYFIFNSLMGFMYGFLSVLQPMYSYWYLLALIVWRLTAHHLAKFKNINLLLMITALVIGFYPSIDNHFAAARIIGFYPWYMAGYLLSKEKSSELINKKYTRRLAMGTGTALLTAGLSFAAYSFFQYSDEALQMAAYKNPQDAPGRIALFVIAFLAICTLRLIVPDRSIPLLTMLGRNSLWIFILHRPFTLMISDMIRELPEAYILLVSIAAALLLCVVFGNEIIVRYLNRFMNAGAALLTAAKEKTDSQKFSLSRVAVLTVCLCFVFSGVLHTMTGMELSGLLNRSQNTSASNADTVSENTPEQDILYPVMTSEQKTAFDNAFRITFSGDLILLEDQVKRAYNGTSYDFSEVFEAAAPYIASADFAIGVFEGPMAGEQEGYSISNFEDGKILYLNFPDEFAQAVKDAGFDLVTTANNHLLDKGEAGALRTIDVLDQIGLAHTGSYKSAADKQNNRVRIVECQGIRIAVLSYTYGSNYIGISDLVNGQYSYLTSVISGTEGELFEQLKASVEQDFKDAKALSPDLIMVLPHIGTQFLNEPDPEQTVWFEIFKENGADIILGDHPHVVEPVVLEEYEGRKVFTAYCPGNFANIYRENQGDTSILTDVYIDRTTKKIIGGSIVPLYTYAQVDHNYKAVPVYNIMSDTALREQLSTDDLSRAERANNIITEVVFGHRMDISSVTERYYLNENGFLRSPATGLALTDSMKNGTLYRALEGADSVCFIGDSVTEGTKNGGCPWYEPILEYCNGKTISNYSKGGCTVSYMTDRIDEIPAADLYVIALGTNDVRYRDSSICAMTSEDYIEALDKLRTGLLSHTPKAQFVFIAPWYSTDGDPFCTMSYDQKAAMNEEYSSALEQYCRKQKIDFINANGTIQRTLRTSPDRIYLLDHIHPNSSKGVVMYSEAVLSEQTST